LRRRGVVLALLAGCGAPPATVGTPAGTPAPLPSPAAIADSGANGIVPAGYGTLKRDDIAVRLQPPDVLVSLIPLDESVIRALASDSYRYLHDILESRRPELTRIAARFGQRRGSVWYAEFTGLAPDARYIPTDVTITSGGRDFRPLQILPLSTGFGSQRLQPREKQYAVYVFDDAVDVGQSLTVTMASERNTEWDAILRNMLDRERAQIRARAARKP